LKTETDFETVQGTESFWERRHHPMAIFAMVVLMALLLALTAFRIHRDYAAGSGEFDWSRRGFSDFHNGSYFPTRAFVDGKTPYSTEVAAEYGMARATPPYSPVVFLIHIPFAVLPLNVSAVLFFGYSVALIAALAWCSLKMSLQPFRWFDFLAITNLLLISRPGHITLYTGYFTTEIVIGCVLALHYAKDRPTISGVGLALASMKPNFLIPLVLLMAIRGNFRALLFGFLFCVLTAGGGIAWLSYHNGLPEVIASVRGGQESLHVDPTEMPVNTWTRVDLVGMFAKVINWVPEDAVYLLGMLMIIALVGVFLRQVSRFEINSGATGPSALIAVLTILLSVYHHSYDCALLAVPAIGLLFFGKVTMPEVPGWIRMLVAILVAVPAVNYLSTKSVMGFLELEPLGFYWQAVTLINGLCLLLALVLLVLGLSKFKTPLPSEASHVAI